MPNAPNDFVFIDVETTGLDPAIDRITEVAALRCTLAGDIQESYSRLIYTTRRIPDEVQALTGITPALLAERGATLESVMKRVAGMVDGRQLVAYNAEFDLGFLKCEAGRCNMALTPSSVRCALEAARAAWPILKRHRLVDVALYVGVTRPTHRALPDCLAGMLVYIDTLDATPDRIIQTDMLAISKLDIENAMACADGETLDLWTKPDFHSVNAYRPNSIYGQGFVIGMPKDNPANHALLKAMKTETPPTLTVSRSSARAIKFNLKL